MLDNFKRFFSSIHLTIFVLILLAVTSAVGTLIPQNAEHRAYQQAYGPLISEMFRVLGIFDTKSSKSLVPYWLRAINCINTPQ